MALLFNNELFSDFHLTDKHNKVNLHKNILMNRLKYFYDLFSGKWKECNSLEVENVRILMPVFEFLYKGIITNYDLNLEEQNELIIYAEEILLFFENNFCMIIFEKLAKYLEINKQNLDLEKIEIGLDILLRYDLSNSLNNLIVKIINEYDDNKLNNIFKIKSFRKFIKKNERYFNLIICHYKENENREILNELKQLPNKDIHNFIFNNMDTLVLFQNIFKSNIAYLNNFVQYTIKYHPLIMVIKIGSINRFTISKKRNNDNDEEYNGIIITLDNFMTKITINDKIICTDNKFIEIELLKYYDDINFSKECEICMGIKQIFVKFKTTIEAIKKNEIVGYPNLWIQRIME